MSEAVAIVNENAAKIHGTLRAVGTADGHFRRPKSRGRVSYHVDATLFYLPPQCLRFDLKKFGNRQFLFGSNDEYYWVYSNADDDYYCRRHGTNEPLPSGEAIRAAELIDALGLTPIHSANSETGVDNASGLVAGDQRITRDMQVLRFSGSSRFPVREYWLDRRPPRLIRRIEFRDHAGRVILQSTLDDYRPVCVDGPFVPFSVDVRWPADAADLRFQAAKWTPMDEVNSASPQFATPKECGVDGGPR